MEDGGMNTQGAERQKLRQILLGLNMGPFISSEHGLDAVTTRLDEVFDAYRRHALRLKSGGFPDSLDLTTFLREYEDNPHRVKVVLQAVASMCTPDMLAMMWMVLLGANIKTLSYTYARYHESKLNVEIVLPDGTTHLRFESEDHWDTAILRFAGISKVNDTPVIESFHPFYFPKKGD
jgi:hypothetical protein